MNHLKWMGYLDTLLSIQRTLKEDNQHCDVVIHTRDISLMAHRFILCACSDFFYNILHDVHAPEKEPITIVIPDVKGEILQQILTFIYLGEASIKSSQLSDFLETVNFMGLNSAISVVCQPNIVVSQPMKNQEQNKLEVDETKEVKYVEVDESKEVKYVEVYNENEKVYTIEPMEGNESDTEYILTESVESNEHTDIHNEESTKSINTSNDHDALKIAVTQSNILTENESMEEDQLDYQQQKYDIQQNKVKKTYKHYEKHDGKNMEDAINAVINDGMILQDAATLFQVSKTVLWKRLKKNPDYKTKDNPLIEAAIEKLSQGETLKKVSTELDMPLSTLHRLKLKLFNEGRLPENVHVRHKQLKEDFKKRLHNAVQACLHGMSQNQASTTFGIPKSTLWRHAKKLNNIKIGIITDKNSKDPQQEQQNLDEEIEYVDIDGIVLTN